MRPFLREGQEDYIMEEKNNQRTGSRNEEQIKKEFATKLKLLILQRKVKQAEVCRALDIPTTSLSAWIRGIAYPSAKYLARLEDYFGVSLTGTRLQGSKIYNISAALEGYDTVVTFNDRILTLAQKRDIYNMVSIYLSDREGKS